MRSNPFRCLCTYIAVTTLTSACKNKYTASDISGSKLYGTWQLLSAQTIKKGDTITTFPVAGLQITRLFNDTHFAWFKHDTTKNAAATFESYSGTYALSGHNYTEQIMYASTRTLEHTASYFFIQLHGDTLIQRAKEVAGNVDVYEEKVQTYVRK